MNEYYARKKNDPDFVAQRKAYHAEWQRKNADKWNAYLREYRKKHNTSVKATTVREFAERLKAKAYTNNYCQEVVLQSDIDQIAKEMLEVANG